MATSHRLTDRRVWNFPRPNEFRTEATRGATIEAFVVVCSRDLCFWVVAALVLSSSAAVQAAEFGVPNAHPLADDSDSARDIDVGTRLVATADVKLRDVSLSKGAKVTVRKLEEKRGRIASFDVELPDGFVLRHIDAGTIRRSFAVASD
ncbi:MAG: hypothetical protein IPM54_14195 [Polyangiaceae bacterium]|nr:hypothetical protein [Polyangiaceae bacterium]